MEPFESMNEVETMKFKVMALGFLVIVAAMACLAADVQWQPRQVTFADTVVVGGTALPAGDYKVEHVMRGAEHIMVFTNVEKKNLRAESKCHMVPSPQKQTRSTQAFTLANGQNTLKTLTFRGDVFVHELY